MFESKIRIRMLETFISTARPALNSRHRGSLPDESAKVAAVWAKRPDDETDWADIPNVVSRLTNHLSHVGRFCHVKASFERVLSCAVATALLNENLLNTCTLVC
jgi:hypothetical protein